jgi:hypothetical protein
MEKVGRVLFFGPGTSVVSGFSRTVMPTPRRRERALYDCSMVRTCLGWLCLVIALVFAAACANPNIDSADPMEIEIDAFSGRPNP